jgi:hypothetical protein
LEDKSVTKPIDKGPEYDRDARMQTGNIAIFIPRLQPRPARNQPPPDLAGVVATRRPDDDDPGPSAA